MYEISKSDFLIRVGKRISAERKRQSLSQLQLAELAGISDKYLSNIDCGRQNPSSNVLLRISKALQVSVDRLLPLNAEHNNRLYKSLNECSDEEQELILKIIDEIIVLVNIAKTTA